jgi:hypothetical protein
MKFWFNIITFLGLLFITEVGHSQIVSDNFTDGDLTINPTWIGNNALFTTNVNSQLQSNDVAAGQAYLSTSFSEESLDNKEWTFWIKQSFAPSDNNQSRLYLASNGTTLNYSGNGSSGNQGYFIRFGEGGSDDALRLFRDDASGTPIELLSGTPTFIGSSFEVRVKVTRDASGLWSLFADGTGGTAFQLQGTTTDNTYPTSSSLGWVCTYTATNADNFYLDDLYFGDIIVDNTAPQLLSASAITANTLDVLFDEAVEQTSAETVINYLLESSINPTLAERDGINFALVHLTFGSDFTPNQDLTLSVSNVTDGSGNEMTTSQTTFSWFVPSTAQFRDVVINEVLADPTPVVGLADAEFIELFNAGEETFDLAEWSLVNSSTVHVIPSYILAPGEYLVLCSEANTSFFDEALGLSSFSALTNDGDSLTLLNNSGDILDILVYDIDWYDTPEKEEGGWSLEQVNPFHPCQGGGANWEESSSPTGGTPGSQNSVFDMSPDEVAPFITNHGIVNPTTLFVSFSEPVDTSSTSPTTWSLIPFNSIYTYQWNGTLDHIELSIQFPITFGNTLELTVSDVSDCSTNTITPVQLIFTLGSVPQIGDIIITEIMADPDPAIQAPPAEYIEILNKSSELIDLAGMSINDAIIEGQVLLPPGEYLVIADQSNALAFLSIPNSLLLEDFPGLTNSGMTITLTSPNSEVIDQVDYTIGWYGDLDKIDGGWSLELININDPCSDKSNWTASQDERGGTAGEINSVYNDSPDIAAPALVYLLMEPQESVMLVFDEPLDGASLENLIWNVDGVNTSTDISFISQENPYALILYYGEMIPNEIHSFTLSGLSDCWGNAIEDVIGFFGLNSEPEVGDLLINEILPDPFDGGSDFVEIINSSSKIISLQNWNIANGEGGMPDDSFVITEDARIILPGEYFLLTEDGGELPGFYPYTSTDRIFQIENLPTLNVGDGEVLLVMPDGSIDDFMTYNSEMHYPLLNSTDGVSLERISIERPSTDQTNWHSAAESQGFATPGYLNSQAFTGGFNAEDITIDPEIFSPDNDGYQDVTTISYINETPGWVASVTIYDSEGREVRKLTSNELLGTQGSISWDGFTENRILAPIGVYIVYFEAFDQEGHVNSSRKTCVLAQKLH